MASIPRGHAAHGAADSPPVRIARTSAGADAVGVGQLAPDPLEQAGRERLVAEDRARLHRADRVPPDRPVRRSQLDPGQLRGPRGERLEAELEARRDGAADVRAVGGHAIERRRGPEVDDDRRRAVQPRRGEGVDEAVGTDLARAVDADRERDRAGRRRRAAAGRAARRPPRPRRSGSGRPTPARSRPRRRRRCRRAGAGPSSSSSNSSVVARGSVAARRVASSAPARKRPIVTFVLPMSRASSIRRDDTRPRRPARRAVARVGGIRVVSESPGAVPSHRVRHPPPTEETPGCPASPPRSSSSTRAS